MKYPAVYHDDGSILFPDLPGCTSRAQSVEEAVRRAQAAAESWLDDAAEEGERWPTPSETVLARPGEVVLWLDVFEKKARAA